MPRSHILWRQRFQNERCKVTYLECGRVRHRCQLACPTSAVRSVVHRPVQQRSRRAASMRPVVARVPPQSYSAGNIKAILNLLTLGCENVPVAVRRLHGSRRDCPRVFDPVFPSCHDASNRPMWGAVVDRLPFSSCSYSVIRGQNVTDVTTVDETVA